MNHLRRAVLLAFFAVPLGVPLAVPATASAYGCAPLLVRMCYPESPGWASRYYGNSASQDNAVNADAEISRIVGTMDRLGADAARRTMVGLYTDAERATVTNRGLWTDSVVNEYEVVQADDRSGDTRASDPSTNEYGTPDGQAIYEPADEPGGATIAGSPDEAAPTDPAARAAWPGTRREVRYRCTHRSLIGLVRFRYWSHWRWYTKGGRVTRAAHWEYATNVGIGWRYDGSRYLEPYGRIGWRMVGRRTEGVFSFQSPVGGTVAQRLPKLTVKVYGNGGSWWNCTGVRR